MVTITGSTLRSNVFEHIYDTLTAANLLSSTVTVTASYIDGNQAFPQVVINPANVDKDEFSFDRSNSTNTINVVLDIFTKKNKDKDLIADEIDALSGLKNINGLIFTGWSESNALEVGNENKLHLKSIVLSYKRR